MKTLIAGLLLMTSVQASAFSMPNLTFPTENGWAIAMVSMACDINTSDMRGMKATISRTSDGVLYTVYENGVVFAEAKANNTSIFAKKVCL